MFDVESIGDIGFELDLNWILINFTIRMEFR